MSPWSAFFNSFFISFFAAWSVGTICKTIVKVVVARKIKEIAEFQAKGIVAVTESYEKNDDQ